MDTPNTDLPYLCDTCRAIDFQALRQNPWSPDDEEPSTTFPLKYSPECILCRFFMLPSSEGVTCVLYAWSFLVDTPWGSSRVSGAEDTILLQATGSASRKNGLVFCTPPGETNQGLFKPRIIENTPNYELARSWLECCVQRHGRRCSEATFAQCHDTLCDEVTYSIEGLKLIDCEDLIIVKGDKSSSWLALSYVWGSKGQSSGQADTKSQHHNESCLPALADIPQTIRDAITVTKHLGYRYLWVDEYCINQRSKTHREDQISKMDQIYRGADLTIVAAAGEDKHYGLPGVSSTDRLKSKIIELQNATIFTIDPDPRDSVIDFSRWFTRAWTFQEGVLSRRLLVFTDHQMSFYCPTASWMEAVGGLEFLDVDQTQWEQWPVNISLFDAYGRTKIPRNFSLKQFMELVHIYSKRKLTFDSDVLSAFSGVMHFLRRSTTPVYNIKGLPYYASYQMLNQEGTYHDVSSSIEQTLFTALSWFSRDHTNTPSRREILPSWTWAGWQSEVCFLCTLIGLNPHQVIEPSLRSIQFEGPNNQFLEQSAMTSRNSDKESFQDLLDTITTIHFEALVIPTSCFHINAYEEVPGYHGRNVKRWCRHSVSGRRLDRWSAPTQDVQDRLIENLESGTWSCLLLGKGNSPGYQTRFVMIVQWKDQEIAERIGAFGIDTTDGEEAEFGPLEKGLEWRRVRLI